MISPCGGCDPHLVAAIVCYLSFFLSSVSFLLYWYWLVSYREECNPLKGRYSSDPDASDCDALEPEALDQDDSFLPEDHHHQNSLTASTSIISAVTIHSYASDCDGDDDPGPSRRDSSYPHHHQITNISHTVQTSGHLSKERDSFLINTITLPSSSSSPPAHQQTFGPGALVVQVSDLESGPNCDLYSNSTSLNDDASEDRRESRSNSSHNEDPRGDAVTVATGEISAPEEEEDDTQNAKLAISNNPYLNGETYTQNLLWGLHGIFTNLVEAILAAIFYSGLFENNLTTTLVWVIGFSVNFILGNFAHALLLLYCTHRGKGRDLWGRWTVETLFNVLKDLYYIWVGVSFLSHLVLQTKKATT